MKLQAKIGENTHQVEIVRNGDEIFAKVDGRQYELEVSEPESGVFVLKNDGKVSEFFVSASASSGSAVTVSSRNGDVEVTLIDPKRLRGSNTAGGSAEGVAEIRTMMPGKVVRLVVKPGDEVAKGDAVLVVEAMKMQNDLKAPKAGVLREVRVAEGATVAAGDVLAVIE